VVLQNNGDRFAKCGDGKLRVFAQPLAVPVIDENGAATGGVRAIDVAPAVADEEAAFQIDVVSSSSPQQHPGLWFSAVARFAVAAAGVETNLDSVERGEIRAQPGVYRFH
jgi:hypothetical protein